MAIALLVLLVLAGVASSVLIAIALLRFSRSVEKRYDRNSEKRDAALRMIPRTQLTAAYIAVALVLIAAMTWRYTGGWLNITALVAGGVAITYLVWFSVRWRHLR
ncbi:MAG: hypothetical protein ACOH1E_02570 [Brevundimonas sp.]